MVTPNLLDKVEGTAATVITTALSISLSFARGVWNHKTSGSDRQVIGVSLLHLRDMVAHGMTDKTFGPLRNFRKDVSLWTLQPFYYISETSHLLHRRDCTGEVHRCFC